MSIERMTATALLEALAARKLSSVEIVRALTERAGRYAGRVNCFSQPLHEQALEAAEGADQARVSGRSLGALHGLPVTIKDNIDVAGHDSTLGIAARVGRPASRDAAVVASLRSQGAIVLAKTNVPQLLLAQETENPVWGLTRNPWHLGRSAGGSSGGEAAAIAAGLSPCGIGTDIGGSIRIPAHFCGLAGLKPTVDRWSNRGSNGAATGQEMVRSQIGPLARSSVDLALLMKAVWATDHSAVDPRVAPIALGEPAEVSVSKLRIGWFDDDGFVTPAAPLRRAVTIAKEALTTAGVELSEYRPVACDDLIYLWMAALSADGGRTMEERLEGAPFIDALKPSARILKMSSLVRGSVARLLAWKGETRTSRLVEILGEKTVQRYWALCDERTRLRRAAFDRWLQGGLDAVVCPAHSVPAMPHSTSGDLTLSLSYPFRYTFLDFPAGVVPVTTVTQAETAEVQVTGDRVERGIASVTAAAEGLPVGVQVVAKPYREDIVLAVMQVIERHARSLFGFPDAPVDPDEST